MATGGPNPEDVPEVAAPPAGETGAPTPPPAPLPDPVAPAERLVSVDVLRGFALLGILVMNIVAFGLPDAAYSNPLLGGGFDGVDRTAWLLSYVFFNMKMMTLFSALFGAGLVLLAERVEGRGGSPAGVYYRRILWLLLIGLLHAYALWWGDILVTYAQCGLLLYLFRRRSARALVALGLGALLLAVPVGVGFSFVIEHLRGEGLAAEAALARGQALGREQREALEIWHDMRRDVSPTAEDVAADAAAYRGSWWDVASRRAPKVLPMQTIAFVAFLVWRAGGTMLLGMGLMKLGVFSAGRSDRFYAAGVAAGYGLGLPLAAFGAWVEEAHGFDLVHTLRWGGWPNYFGSLLVAAGHLGLVMLACRRGLFPALLRRLAAVGRMALSNYLAHTLICTTLFYGYGFGLFGRLSRAELLLVVAAIWAAQLLWSEPWLRAYRFGPAEWAWRSLTYRRLQPMRVTAGG